MTSAGSGPCTADRGGQSPLELTGAGAQMAGVAGDGSEVL